MGTANVAGVKLTAKKLGAAAESLCSTLHVSAGVIYGWTMRSQLQQPWQTLMHDEFFFF